MSLIIYSKFDSKNSCGIKQINDSTFRKLMYNEIHKKGRFVIPTSKLEKEFEITLGTNKEESEVIFMTELNENQLNNYLEIYEEESDNLDKYAEFLSIIKYNQINPEKFKIKKKLDSLLASVSDYWEDPLNCNFTLTNKFIDRRFNNSNYIGNNEIINNTFLKNTNVNVSKDINFGKNEIDWNSREINYLNDIFKDKNWKDMTLKKYNLPKVSSLSNIDVLDIYNQLPTEFMKYNFICNLLCSRSHCHLILGSYELLKQAKPIFDKYKIVFKYLIGYSWLTLKNEEYHLYNKINDSDRIIFDIDTANLLPIFPFTWDDINQNPYASVLIDKDILELKKNCLSLDMMRNYEKYYGVCTSKEFSRRLNIFVNGTNTKGILDHIDWSCCAITGSVMTACGMKYNPLLDICKTSNNMNEITDVDLSSFFFHYYQDSDIDLICNKESIIDFIDVVQQLISSLTPKEKITVDNIHTGTIVLSDDFISSEIEQMKKTLKNNKLDLEYIRSNFGSQDIKNYFYDKFYIPWKTEQFDRIKNLNKHTEQLFKEYLNPIPREEFRIYSLDYDLDEEKIYKKDYEKYFYLNDLYQIDKNDITTNKQNNIEQNNIEQNKLVAKLSESIRFKLKSQGVKTFEIFKSRDKNFFSVVSRFHMGFVRAIWNGQIVKCLPSYITSMMLQLAVDYKYFSSIRDPIEIVNKYRSRGFGIILNDYEKLHMAYYNSVKNKNHDENSKWIEIYKVNLKDKKSIENIFGVKKSSDDIFKPSKYFMGLPQDCFKNINHDTISTFDECFSSIITPSTLSLSKYKAINDNGKINPLAREVISLGWNLLNLNPNQNFNSNPNTNPNPNPQINLETI